MRKGSENQDKIDGGSVPLENLGQRPLYTEVRKKAPGKATPQAPSEESYVPLKASRQQYGSFKEGMITFPAEESSTEEPFDSAYVETAFPTVEGMGEDETYYEIPAESGPSIPGQNNWMEDQADADEEIRKQRSLARKTALEERRLSNSSSDASSESGNASDSHDHWALLGKGAPLQTVILAAIRGSRGMTPSIKAAAQMNVIRLFGKLDLKNNPLSSKDMNTLVSFAVTATETVLTELEYPMLRTLLIEFEKKGGLTAEKIHEVNALLKKVGMAFLVRKHGARGEFNPGYVAMGDEEGDEHSALYASVDDGVETLGQNSQRFLSGVTAQQAELIASGKRKAILRKATPGELLDGATIYDMAAGERPTEQLYSLGTNNVSGQREEIYVLASPEEVKDFFGAAPELEELYGNMGGDGEVLYDVSTIQGLRRTPTRRESYYDVAGSAFPNSDALDQVYALASPHQEYLEIVSENQPPKKPALPARRKPTELFAVVARANEAYEAPVMQTFKSPEEFAVYGKHEVVIPIQDTAKLIEATFMGLTPNEKAFFKGYFNAILGYGFVFADDKAQKQKSMFNWKILTGSFIVLAGGVGALAWHFTQSGSAAQSGTEGPTTPEDPSASTEPYREFCNRTVTYLAEQGARVIAQNGTEVAVVAQATATGLMQAGNATLITLAAALNALPTFGLLLESLRQKHCNEVAVDMYPTEFPTGVEKFGECEVYEDCSSDLIVPTTTSASTSKATTATTTKKPTTSTKATTSTTSATTTASTSTPTTTPTTSTTTTATTNTVPATTTTSTTASTAASTTTSTVPTTPTETTVPTTPTTTTPTTTPTTSTTTATTTETTTSSTLTPTTTETTTPTTTATTSTPTTTPTTAVTTTPTTTTTKSDIAGLQCLDCSLFTCIKIRYKRTDGSDKESLESCWCSDNPQLNPNPNFRVNCPFVPPVSACTSDEFQQLQQVCQP